MSSPAVPAVPLLAQEQVPAQRAGALLVCLPSLSPGSVESLRSLVAELDPHGQLLLAAPEGTLVNFGTNPGLIFPVPSLSHPTWVLTPSDYSAAADLAEQQNASATLILGSDPGEISPEEFQALLAPILANGADLTIPRYRTGAHDGLVSAALLYPLTRTLFGAVAHAPLPLDIAFSQRAPTRFRAAARRLAAGGSPDGFLWPVAEAATANLRVLEVDAGKRTLPQPESSDLNTLLGEVLGSLFSDIEVKASFWQRGRVPDPASALHAPTPPSALADLADIAAMADAFRNAYTNLQQIWALVLPPHSLLALKKLSQTGPEAFVMDRALWARTVYEFILAFHLRTLNRGHLLGAFTPLYLAWVASYLREVGDDPTLAARHVEDTAAAFEAEKPYLVSRWRWPDRFNP